MTFHDFEQLWKKIPQTNNGYVSLDSDSPLKLELGYHANNTKSFVVDDVGNLEPLPSSNAIHANIYILSNGTKILEFQLVNNEYEDVFLRLCWDLINSTVGIPKPLTALIERYLKWQKLLQRMSSGTLSYERQKGLLGELLYLEEMIKRIGCEAAVAAWVGPEGSDQDFVFCRDWTEVKTISIGAKVVRISSLEQLNQNCIGALHIFILESTTPGENRKTLNGEISRIRALLMDDPIVRDKFETKLVMAGYNPTDKLKYEKNVFRFVEEREYSVDKDFPKLTSANVPIGVQECKYAISLSTIENFRRQ